MLLHALRLGVATQTLSILGIQDTEYFMGTLNNIKKQIIYRVKGTNKNPSPVKAGPKILHLGDTAKFLSFPCI